jgi:hypothetical protein
MDVIIRMNEISQKSMVLVQTVFTDAADCTGFNAPAPRTARMTRYSGIVIHSNALQVRFISALTTASFQVAERGSDVGFESP